MRRYRRYTRNMSTYMLCMHFSPVRSAQSETMHPAPTATSDSQSRLRTAGCCARSRPPAPTRRPSSCCCKRRHPGSAGSPPRRRRSKSPDCRGCRSHLYRTRVRDAQAGCVYARSAERRFPRARGGEGTPPGLGQARQQYHITVARSQVSTSRRPMRWRTSMHAQGVCHVRTLC